MHPFGRPIPITVDAPISDPAGLLRPTAVPLLDRALGGIAPGLPLVIAGPTGTGRTVFCLQLARAALSRAERVVYLTAEPCSALLRQADSLDLGLSGHLESGRLVLLELAPDVSSVVRAHGVAPLVSQLAAEISEPALAIVDPLTALTGEVLDDIALREAVAELFRLNAGPGQGMVVTVDIGPMGSQPALERAVSDLCGALVYLSREESGERHLSVLKSRLGSPGADRLQYRIGPGGSATLEPEVGSGVPVSAIPAAPSTCTEPATRRPRVLVVDDDGESRQAVVECLREHYEVSTASDGFSALSAVLSQRPDLVVLDLVLPRVSGVEVLRALQRSSNAIPVLAVSDRLARTADRIRALVLGASDVLAKPASRFEVLHKVDALLRLTPPDSLDVDDEDCDLMLVAASRGRKVEDAEFRTRAERAARLGERFEVPSILVALETQDPDHLEAVESAAEDTLRAEDALLRVGDRRSLLLLVAAGPERARPIMARIQRRARKKLANSKLELSWFCRVLTLESEQESWDKYFDRVSGEDPGDDA